MPRIAPITNRASNALAVALPLLTSLSNPVSAAIAGGVALIGLVDKIGQGRRTANKMTDPGAPQDIINKQLQAIAASQSSPQEKAQATDRAWKQFLQSSAEFARQGPTHAKVAEQAIYRTPGLTNTVKSLLGGQDPLDPAYISEATQGISAGRGRGNEQPIAGTLINAGLSAAAPFIVGRNRGTGGGNGGGLDDIDLDTGAPNGGGVGGGADVGNRGGLSSIVDQIFGGDGEGGFSGLLETLIPAGMSLAGGVLNSRAATNAGNTQAAAADRAAQLQSDTARNSLDFAKEVYGDQQEANRPFLQAGTNALGEVQRLIGPGGELAGDFVPPTIEEVREKPGYKLRLDEAMKALERTTRGVTSGATVRAGVRFANDYADSSYRTDVNDAMGRFQTNRANRLDPLMQIAGFGPSAVQTGNQSGNNAVSTTANINQGMADNLSDLGQGAAYHRATSQVGRTNALTEAMNQIANLASQRRLLRDLGAS